MVDKSELAGSQNQVWKYINLHSWILVREWYMEWSKEEYSIYYWLNIKPTNTHLA